jgi:uncharacterized protein YydD (DUF2326 family)
MKDKKYNIAIQIKEIDQDIVKLENLLDKLHKKRNKLIGSLFTFLKNEGMLEQIKNRQHKSMANG